MSIFDVRGGGRAGWRAGSCAGCCAGSNPRRAPTSPPSCERACTRPGARVCVPAQAWARMPAHPRTPRTWRTSRPAARTAGRTVLAPAHLPFPIVLVEKQEAVA
ncbi:MAG: hypothetical protein ACK5X3_09020 [Pseudomonadota bacterium]